MGSRAVGTRGARLLVAVSGGADSLALLLLTAAAFPGRCLAATVDHGLRPAAAAEADLVAKHCRSIGVEHRILRGEMPPRVNGSANLSARARALRYRLLEQDCLDRDAARILTAHHADDQAETMVMRVNRSSGLTGLAGIPALHGRVARPVLGWRHRDLVEIVRAANWEWVEDPSNSDERFDRARLRRLLAESGLIDAGAAAESVRLLRQANEAIEWFVDETIESFVTPEPHMLPYPVLLYPHEFRSRFVLRALRWIVPDAAPRGANLERLVAALRDRRSATLAGVKVTPRDVLDARSGATATFLRFGPAPPRRPVSAPIG